VRARARFYARSLTCGLIEEDVSLPLSLSLSLFGRAAIPHVYREIFEARGVTAPATPVKQEGGRALGEKGEKRVAMMKNSDHRANVRSPLHRGGCASACRHVSMNHDSAQARIRERLHPRLRATANPSHKSASGMRDEDASSEGTESRTR